jgi:hypothetical protein
VLYKEGTGHGETGVGGNWTPVMGKMRQISVGDKVSLLKGLCYEIYQTAFFSTYEIMKRPFLILMLHSLD